MPFLRRLRDYVLPHKDNAYRPYLLRRGWLVFALAMVLATEGFLVASLVARQSGGSFLASVIAGELISLTNDQRSSERLTMLSENAELDAAAKAKAEDMALKGYFAHVAPDGTQPWDWITGAGYNYLYAGENLAVRFVDSKDVMQAWMESPGHRANIERPVYREIGIGVAEGTYKGEPATYVVQYFGTPQGTAVLGAESVAPSAHQTSSFMQTLVRAATQVLGNPKQSAAWALGGIATLLILLIGLTFLFHIHIQPTGMLLSGAAVAMVALMLYSFNSSLLGAGGNQAANAESAFVGQSVVIDEGGASTSR